MTKKLIILSVLATFFVLGLAQTAQASSLRDTLLKTGSTGAKDSISASNSGVRFLE
ncbi:MAG: hypothetical protein P4L69_22140 [Desulfosporosinus sp.]|nr:hypothetical protein [Desulfosporosinus sp.]